MTYQALARKWRPKTFAEVVGQPYTVRALQNALASGHLHHAYLLTGTRGVGKTTIARIIAKCLNCEQGISREPCQTCETCLAIDGGHFVDLFEIDAASRTKVEDTRELLDNVAYTPARGRYKVYLIDEVHMLSNHSFNALLKTLEEPPQHVIFILATTDPEKIPATILSRCLQFHLHALTNEEISKQLAYILDQEKIPHETDALALLAKAAKGSMRDALSLLDQAIAYCDRDLQAAPLKVMLGLAGEDYVAQILLAIAANDAESILKLSHTISSQGIDFIRVTESIIEHLHQISISQLTPHYQSTLDPQVLTGLSQSLDPETTQLFYQIALMSQRDIQLAPSAKIGFEMMLMRMLAFSPHGEDISTPTTSNKQTTKVNNSVNQETAALPTASSDTIKADTSPHSWAQISAKLPLSGLCRALADNLALVKQDSDTFHFELNNSHKALISQKHQDRIAQALSDYYNRQVYVKIIVTNGVNHTPNQIKQRHQEERQQALERAITEDHQVQRIMNAFDAAVVKESIRAND